MTTRRTPIARGFAVLALALAGTVAVPMVQAAQDKVASAAAARHPTSAYWRDVSGVLPATATSGAKASIKPKKFRATTLDKLSIAGMVAGAPMEFSQAARLSPLVISLPHPDGGFQRFSLVESPIMEAGLAANHPEIKTYAGRGIDDPTANLRMDISPLGVHASVRAAGGSWYIDPGYHLDDSAYISYFARDLPNPRAPLSESLLAEAQLSLSKGRYHARDSVDISGVGFAPGAQVTITVRNTETDASARQTVYAVASADGTLSAKVTADPYRNTGSYAVTATDGSTSATSSYQVIADGSTTDAVSGPQLRTYRLALVTDPSYATYFGGSANVTAAKVALVNRVTQLYETEVSIRLVLVANNDRLNLDTVDLMSGANGPCGSAACFSTAAAASCTTTNTTGTLARNRVVTGLLIGANNFDIGHIALGVNGGGVASLGVVGGNNKSQGCTGVPTPVGDYYAVDYVAHEMGHQFSGNHTFNGTVSNCSTSNRSAATSVEPGSGSSIMAYAGICGTDNLQPHSDPYFSQRSFDEFTTYTGGTETNLNEIQMAGIANFNTDGQSFRLRANGVLTPPITRGSKTFTTAGIKAVLEQTAGWPAGGTVTVSALTDGGFTLTYGGTLANVRAPDVALVNCTGGCTGILNAITKGGPTTKNGIAVTPTGNTAPVVTVPATMTIPVRTPFALTGSATDVDGDTVTYMWEQNDRGATGTANGTGLITQPKLNGPLFRQFGVRAVVSTADSLQYGSPNENLVTTNPTRVFPDMAQVLANNTNAESGVCPTASATPTGDQIDCFSEYLPTALYVGTAGVNASPASLNFRLTARDGKGGVASGNVQLLLAATAGPFLVTSPNTAVTLTAGAAQTVTWDVANTNAAPVSTSNVKISLSTDGGATFPFVLAASTPNTGTAVVTLPAVATTAARIKIEAVGNVFFDVSNADFTITVPPVRVSTTRQR